MVSFVLGMLTYKYINKPKVSESKQKIIKKLVRQAARWSTAAKQDKSHLIAVLHANYGAGYLWALKDAATDTEIESVAGISIKKFENEIVSTQDAVTKLAIAKCPSFAPEPTYLTKIGGE